MKKIAVEELKKMTDFEGLVIQGCGGDLQEWVDGINNVLTEAGILLGGDTFRDVLTFEHNGHTNLLFNMDGVKLNVGALAMWRLQTHSTLKETGQLLPGMLKMFIKRENCFKIQLVQKLHKFKKKAVERSHEIITFTILM